jgi:hypothetical protein
VASDQSATYDDVVAQLAEEGAVPGKMFGMPCIKLGGKAIACVAEDAMVFKLRGEDRERALAIQGAHLFDPMGGRPMKEWVEIPVAASERWPEFGRSALRLMSKAL